MKDSTGRRLDSFEVASLEAVSPAVQNAYVPVATDACPPFDSSVGLSDGVVMGGTAKLAHLATRTFYGVRLAYSNWYAGAGNTEQDSPNAITVRAAVEPLGNVIMPVTFNGARSVVIQPGATVLSDPLGVDITKATTFYTRTYVSVASGERFPRGGYITASSGEGNNYADPAGADLTAIGSASLTGVGTNVRVFGPSMILGRVKDPGKAVIPIVGDSIAQGSQDNDRGYIQRGLGDNYSFQKLAFPGESLDGWTGNNGLTRMRRASLMAQVAPTHVICEYGRNNMSSATIQADTLAAWTSLRRMNVSVYQTTITPQTTSSDSWVTVANQTVANATYEGRRVAFNDWLRDGAPISAGAPVAVGTVSAIRAGESGHPLSGWFEIADLSESARNSGKWKASYTTDGTHPNATAAAALAAGIDPTVFGEASVA
jgi:lysophospholipase L1-like esterase